MARQPGFSTDIRDSLTSDPRFLEYVMGIQQEKFEEFNKLMTIADVEDLAIGRIRRVYRLARIYWCSTKTPCSPIPKEEWEKYRCDNKLVSVGLVELTPAGYRACGSAENFANLMQKVNASIQAKQKRDLARELAKENPKSVVNKRKVRRRPAGHRPITDRTPTDHRPETGL